ncbi:hypothetical protein A2V94_07160 [Candidatus Atribacteria bacterium RBG_16_35_8]|nr:MAG: hypothetical protein A2V94_07160 [Candidatus Atribacteria bacterium RBG_16_35_8]
MLKRTAYYLCEEKTGIPLLYTEESDFYFKDMIMSEYLHNSFSKFENEFKDRALLSTQGRHLSNKLLFSGPRGCGKSCAARALSNSINLSLLYADMLELSLLSTNNINMVGNLLKIIEHTCETNTILFFDNWDCIEKFNQMKYIYFILNKIENYYNVFAPIIICAINSSAYSSYFDIEMKFSMPNTNNLINFIRNEFEDLKLDKYELNLLLTILGDKSYREVLKVLNDIKNRYLIQIHHNNISISPYAGTNNVMLQVIKNVL